MPSSSFPVGKTVGAISCTTMTLFTKCYPPPLSTRINNTVPALKTTTVNRPVPALKKKRTSRRKQKIQPPGPVAEKTQPPRPVPPRKNNTTAPSRLGKKTTAPSHLEKKNNRPVPPRILARKIPSRPVPPGISTPIFCQSRAPAEIKKVGQPSIFPPSRPVEILAVHVKPWKFRFRSRLRLTIETVDVGVLEEVAAAGRRGQWTSVLSSLNYPALLTHTFF